MEKLDAICMQLIAIGESLKKFDNIADTQVLSKYPQIEWKKAMGLRDVTDHHYFDVNSEAIYSVCKDNIPSLADTSNKIIRDIEQQK